MLAAALANSHVLFEDYPGLGKTLLAKVFGKALDCQYTRIQFTPDLLPADVIGTKVWRQTDGEFFLVKGPIFTNVLLADEINRAPPKTQSALLEAMEERQLTIDGETHTLEQPFVVLATQNPIEQEGTYPLPEAQMDRFALRLSTGYASTAQEESQILQRRIQWQQDDPSDHLAPVMSRETFRALQQILERMVYVDPAILEYVSVIVRGTRTHPKVEVGASPRGGLAILKVARAGALMEGRDFVTPDDVKFIARDALAHRIILRVEEALEGVHEGQVVDEVIAQTPVPKDVRARPT
ncbi:MAG: MoxR family ATPase [Chloroflexi bacterium]|nr:MoxR family ATPase [Chloroflexota bacterium]